MEQIHRSQLSGQSRHHPTHVCPPGCATVPRQGKFATNKVSIRTSPIHTHHHHASQISLFHQVFRILPPGNPSPTLKLASSEATNRVRSRQLWILRDDQALATGSVRFEGAFAVPRCLPPALFHPLTTRLPPPPTCATTLSSHFLAH